MSYLNNPYIDEDYYLNEFSGIPHADPEEFDRLAKRASDVIDAIVNYKTKLVTEKDEFVADQIKKATSAMVEVYVSHGGYDAYVSKSTTNVSIGNFSYSLGESSGSSNKEKDQMRQIPGTVVNYLLPTGLLYAGIGSV